MKRINIFILATIFLFSGCATVYISPGGKYLASDHRSLAILPPKVSIPPSKGITADVLKDQQFTESRIFQQEIYTYLLKRKSKGQMAINIQEVETTNVLLSRNNLDIENMTTEEICELLSVDGLLYSQFGLSKPMSPLVAIVTTVLFGYSKTNEVNISLSIKDCNSKSLLWKYDHKFSGGLGSTSATLVKSLMRDASKKMPYFQSRY